MIFIQPSPVRESFEHASSKVDSRQSLLPIDSTCFEVFSIRYVEYDVVP